MSQIEYEYDTHKLGLFLDKWFPEWEEWSDEMLMQKIAESLEIDVPANQLQR